VERLEGIGDVRRVCSGEILFAEELISFEVWQGVVSLALTAPLRLRQTPATT
jgi:hypothetical protein